MAKLFGISVGLYLAVWTAHLITGTLALRGFFGDGALAFIIHLSQSYVFNTDSSWVHLFSVGFPRDTQLFLNAIGLQVALWAHVTDPMTLKYVFVLWQFALPGFLYLTLFCVLWRKEKIGWAVFPLVSWAIFSVPLDWNAVNSTRWAVPVFWMHFFLVLLADTKLRPWSAFTALLLGAAMWGGLYESVILQCAVTLALGAWLWWREGNRVPLLYAAVSIPGAIRSILSLIGGTHAAPNGFHGFFLPHLLTQPYFLLMAMTVAFILLLGKNAKLVPHPFYFILLLVLFALGVNLVFNPLPNVWLQTELRFDYVFAALGLMVWAALWRILKWEPRDIALPAATLTVVVGAVLWSVQIRQTFIWQSCITAYQNNKPDKPLLTDPFIARLLRTDEKVGIIDRNTYAQCLWDWTTPWADMLLKPDGQITQWPVYTFWQDFRFIEKDGKIFLHTNNWSLTTPTFQPDEADLPLKTLLYDLTPLYQRLGTGEIIPRERCQKAALAGAYWHNYLMTLDNDNRRLLFVCPR